MSTTRSTLFHTFQFTLLRPIRIRLANCAAYFLWKQLHMNFRCTNSTDRFYKSYLGVLPILIVDHSNTGRESGLQSNMVYPSKYDCHAFLISVIYPILKCITIKQGCKHQFFHFSMCSNGKRKVNLTRQLETDFIFYLKCISYLTFRLSMFKYSNENLIFY